MTLMATYIHMLGRRPPPRAVQAIIQGPPVQMPPTDTQHCMELSQANVLTECRYHVLLELIFGQASPWSLDPVSSALQAPWSIAMPCTIVVRWDAAPHRWDEHTWPRSNECQKGCDNV